MEEFLPTETRRSSFGGDSTSRNSEEVAKRRMSYYHLLEVVPSVDGEQVLTDVEHWEKSSESESEEQKLLETVSSAKAAYNDSLALSFMAEQRTKIGLLSGDSFPPNVTDTEEIFSSDEDYEAGNAVASRVPHDSSRSLPNESLAARRAHLKSLHGCVAKDQFDGSDFKEDNDTSSLLKVNKLKTKKKKTKKYLRAANYYSLTNNDSEELTDIEDVYMSDSEILRRRCFADHEVQSSSEEQSKRFADQTDKLTVAVLSFDEGTTDLDVFTASSEDESVVIQKAAPKIEFSGKEYACAETFSKEQHAAFKDYFIQSNNDKTDEEEMSSANEDIINTYFPGSTKVKMENSSIVFAEKYSEKIPTMLTHKMYANPKQSYKKVHCKQATVKSSPEPLTDVSSLSEEESNDVNILSSVFERPINKDETETETECVSGSEENDHSDCLLTIEEFMQESLSTFKDLCIVGWQAFPNSFKKNLYEDSQVDTLASFDNYPLSESEEIVCSEDELGGPSEGMEWTETDESGAVKHIIQKTTHTTVKIQGDQPFSTQGTEKSETAVKMRRDQTKKPKADGESSQEEEELSFEQKKNYFQRLSVDASIPVPITKTTAKPLEGKKRDSLADSEVVEEQICFADRRRFFEEGKASSGESETTASDLVSETREFQEKKELEPEQLDEYVRTMIVEETKMLHEGGDRPERELKFLEGEAIIEAKVSPTITASIGDLTIRKMTDGVGEPQEKWKKLDHDIEQARETMEIMEKELKEVVEAKEAEDKIKKDENLSAITDKSSTESKLIVKTSGADGDHVEVRTVKSFGDGSQSEIARVLVRSVISPAAAEEHAFQDQWTEPSQDQVPTKDYPSPLKTVSFEEAESPIPRPSPPEPSLELEQEISPVVEYPSTLSTDLQVHVGVSPTEMYSYQQEMPCKEEKDSLILEDVDKDVFHEDQYVEAKAPVLRTVTSRSWTDSSGTIPSETSVDSDAEPVDRVLAYENTAFVGAEIIDEFEQPDGEYGQSTEVRSPYEVVRKNEEKSFVSTTLSDSSFEAETAVDQTVEKRAEVIEKLPESPEEIEQRIMSQILSEELDQSLEENLPEVKPLSRDTSTDVLNDINREQQLAQQIRSEIFTHELEEDIGRGSPERKEIVCGGKDKHESSDSDASMVVHPDIIAGSELTQQSPDGLSLEASEIFEATPADTGESAPEDMAESVPSDMVESLPSDEVAVEEILIMESSLEQIGVDDSMVTNDGFEPEICEAEQLVTEQIMWETSVQQDSEGSIGEEVNSIPTVKQLIVEHDEEDGKEGGSDFDEYQRPDKEVARETAEKIIEDIKSKVSARPPLMHIPSEISDEDLVEREERVSPQEPKTLFKDSEPLHEDTDQISIVPETEREELDKDEEDEDSHTKEDAKFLSDSDVPITITPSESSDIFDHSEASKPLGESSSKKAVGYDSKKTDGKSDSDYSDKPAQENLVVLRRKKPHPKPDEKRYSKEFESYSSSGETESHYCSFETSESTRTPRETPAGSRPTSSEFEINLTSGQVSEYDTCVTSQEGSYMTATSSQDASFQTARSSMSHSDRESAYSIDSESSGHLASLEISSEASETLVPSAQELELDLPPEIQTPTPDDEVLRREMHEPYEMDIPESIIRSGVENPFVQDWQAKCTSYTSEQVPGSIPKSFYKRYDDDEDDDEENDDYEGKGAQYKPYPFGVKEPLTGSSIPIPKTSHSQRFDRSDSSESCSSTADSTSPSTKTLGSEKKVVLRTEETLQKEELEVTEHSGAAVDDDALSVSESSVTQSETTWQTLSTETVIYTTTSTSTVQPQVTYSVSHIGGDQTSWYSQANGPVEVEFIPEYDTGDDYSDNHIVEQHPVTEQHSEEIDEVNFPSAPTMFQSTLPGHSYIYSTGNDEVPDLYSRSTAQEVVEDISREEDTLGALDQEEVLGAAAAAATNDDYGSSDAGRGSLKASQHPSLPESDLQDDFVAESPDGFQTTVPLPEPKEPLMDDRSCLPESEQGEMCTQPGPSYAHELGSHSMHHSVAHVSKTVTSSTSEYLEKGLDTSPEDDQYEVGSRQKRVPLAPSPAPEPYDNVPAPYLYKDGMFNENNMIGQDIFNPQLQAPAQFESEEAMEIESDRGPDDKDEDDVPEAPYAYGMQFEKEHDFEDPHGYTDLYTHHEEDEDFEGEDDKPKAFDSPSPAPSSFGSPAPSMFDTLAGRRLFGKSGEQDDVSTSSLQEFERLEAELVSGRKSSVGSLDSLNEKPARSKSGEHDDVSMNSLTEFEKLEREIVVEPEKVEPVTKELKLSEIDEGHESQASEGSQGTLSEHGDDQSNDSDDYEKRLSEIDEIIRQAQSNVEMFEKPGEHVQKLAEDKRLSRFSGTLSSNGSTESSMVDRSPSPKRDDDSLEGAVAASFNVLTRQEAVDASSVAPPVIPRHVLAERTISGQSMESVESLPKSSAGSTATQYDAESLRDQDLEVDEVDEEKSHASFYEKEDLEPDSLHQEEQSVEHDSLIERSQEIDSLQEMASAMQDSLYQVKEIDNDELYIPEPPERVGTTHTSFSRSDGGIAGQLTEILEEYSRKETEPMIIEASLKGDCMISSTDSLEVSSSTATHATYQFETDSVMSSSLNSVQTSGEESTMVSNTETLEPEAKLSYSISEGDSVIHIAPRKPCADPGGSLYGSAVSGGAQSGGGVSESSKVTGSTVFSGHDSEGLWKTVKEKSYEDGSATEDTCSSVDEKGNVVITKKICRTVVLDPHTSDQKLPFESKEMMEFLKQTAFSTSSGDEEVEENETVDETGNVVITRTVKRHVLSEPQVHTETFLGPDADIQSQEFLKSLEEMQPTQDLDEYEDTDEHGNLIRVTQQVIIKPEVRTMTFSGPDAQKQLEDFMRSCNVEAPHPIQYQLGEDDPSSVSAQYPSHPFDATDPSTASSDMTLQTTTVHLGGHLVAGSSASYSPQDATSDSAEAVQRDICGDYRDADEIQVRNDFYLEGDFGDGTFTNSVVTTRTTTHVFPEGEEEIEEDSVASPDEAEPDPLRRSMQDILDKFLSEDDEEKK